MDVKEAKNKNNQKHLAAYLKQLILSLCIESYKPLTLKVNFLCNIFGFDMSFLVANKYFSIFLDSPALCLDPLIKFISYKRKKKCQLNCQSHMGDEVQVGLWVTAKQGGRSESRRLFQRKHKFMPSPKDTGLLMWWNWKKTLPSLSLNTRCCITWRGHELQDKGAQGTLRKPWSQVEINSNSAHIIIIIVKLGHVIDNHYPTLTPQGAHERVKPNGHPSSFQLLPTGLNLLTAATTVSHKCSVVERY